MKNKAFTLIELLAVIIILGILMLIAIPSVTKYINDSRKNTYVNTVKEIIRSTVNTINEGELDVFDTNTTYYIPASYIKTENGDARSPYGEFTQAYIGVTYDGESYNYYWISVDETGVGVDEIIPEDKLDVSDLKTNIDSDDIEDKIKTTGIGSRTNIKVLKVADEEWINYTASDNIPEEGSSSGGGNTNSNVVFTVRANPKSISVGDELTIDDLGTFKVIEINGTEVVLFPKYNLNVGSNMSPSFPEFAQDASLRDGIAAVIYSDTDYWSGNIGEGKTYAGKPGESPYGYVFDSNSALSDFAVRYQALVRSKGLDSASVKLLRYEQASDLESSYYDYLYSSTFWLGSARWGSMYIVEDVSGNSIKAVAFNSAEGRGFRPIIEVTNSDLLK